MTKISSHGSRISQVSAILFVILGAALTAVGVRELHTLQSAGGMWRWGWQYLLIFGGLGLVIGILSLWRGPVIATLIVGAGAVIAGNAISPLVTVAGLALSAYTLGHLVFRHKDVALTDRLLVGITLLGTVLSLMVHLPINYPATWGLLFALPILAGRKLWRDLPVGSLASKTKDWHLYALECAIGAAALLHLLVSLMPEIGHDALAMHLFVPTQIAYRHAWDFNVELYAWAAMPMLVDWCYSAAYMFAGETAARLLNFGGIVLMTTMVHRLARWMGAGPVAAAWAVLLFLVTPLTFTESSSLFVEALWSALVLGGTLALLRLFTEPPENSSRQFLLGSLLWAGALAAKAITFTILPGMMLILVIGARRWLTHVPPRTWVAGLLGFLAIGLVPYAASFILTGNPVFPYFNELFKSPLYPAANFKPPAIFEHGVAWDTLYRITFESGKYLESTPGAAGFHWLLLVLPAIVTLLLVRNRRALSVVLIAGAALLLTFGQTAYLRYVFPSFALSCAIIAPALASLYAQGGFAWRTGIVAALAAGVLDLLHFNAGTFYGNIDPQVIIDTHARDAYIEKIQPVRAAVELVNKLDQQHSPTAFFSAPLLAGLKANALSNTWYNQRFSGAVQESHTAEELGQTLARHGAGYVITEATWVPPELLERVNQATIEVAHIGAVSVRRLNEDYRFTRELLPSTKFDSTTAWNFASGTRRLQGNELLANVEETAHTGVPVQPGTLYRYRAEVRCGDVPDAEARLQVNWIRADGQFIYPDIQVFRCSAQTEKHVMDIRAPADAAQAVVYASGHTKQFVVFSSISFRD